MSDATNPAAKPILVMTIFLLVLLGFAGGFHLGISLGVERAERLATQREAEQTQLLEIEAENQAETAILVIESAALLREDRPNAALTVLDKLAAASVRSFAARSGQYETAAQSEAWRRLRVVANQYAERYGGLSANAARVARPLDSVPQASASDFLPGGALATPPEPEIEPTPTDESLQIETEN